MAIENGIITSPISIEDVASALGEGSRDLGTLATSDKINPWAKFKPNIVSGNPINTPSDWWKGTDGNCGFRIPVVRAMTTAAGMKNLLPYYLDLEGMNGWGYRKAAGMYRLLDFAGYNHAALPPFDFIFKNDELEIKVGTSTVWVTPFLRTGFSGYDVKLQDIARIAIADPTDNSKRFRFGAFLLGTVNGKEYFTRTISETPLFAEDSQLVGGDLHAMVQLNTATLPIGEYTIYPMIGSEAISGDKASLDVEIYMIPFPNLRPAKLKVVQSSIHDAFTISGNATASKTLEGVSVAFSFLFTNNGAVDKTLTNNYVRYWPNGKSTNAAYMDYVIKDITIAAGEQAEITRTEILNTVLLLSEWEYSFNNGEYKLGPMSIDFKVQDDFVPGSPVLPTLE